MQTEQNGQRMQIFCALIFKNSKCISFSWSPDIHSITGRHSKDSRLHTQPMECASMTQCRQSPWFPTWEMDFDGSISGTGVEASWRPVDASDQTSVSHIKLGEESQVAALHGECAQQAFVVSSPNLTATVAHGAQIGAQLNFL